MYKVLFVCSGNTCRSPLAEALLKKAVSEDPQLKDQVVVSSCGTTTHEKDFVNFKAVEAGKKLGVNLEGFQSRQFTPDGAEKFDAIIGMTTAHRDIIAERFPELADKTYAIYEYTTGERDCMNVKDPYGCDEEVYDRVAKELESLVSLMLPVIKENL